MAPSFLSSLQTLTFLLLSLLSHSAAYKPKDVYRIMCGASSSAQDSQGREWTGDAANGGSANAYLNLNVGKDISASAGTAISSNLPDTVPYSTARIFASPGSYSFPMSPGRHWVRLHFYPFDFSTFNISDAILTVNTDSFTLMQNVSLSYVLDALNLYYIVKEFSVNVTGNFLSLFFVPGNSANAFAMVNGIEIMSMPDDMYQSSLKTVGVDAQIPYALSNTVLESVVRLNVGGQSIRESEDDLGRMWNTDVAYTVGARQGVATSISTAPISYKMVPNYTAPVHVYDSARMMTNDDRLNLQWNLTWTVPVDANFTYYVRLHFCDIQYDKPNMRVFDIYIDREVAFTLFDVVAYSGGKYVASTLDFAILPSDAQTIVVELHPNNSTNTSWYNAILNGLEVFKLNDSNGNLQGAPTPLHAILSEQIDQTLLSQKSSSSIKISIIGGVAGSVAAVTAVAIILLCFRQRRQKGADGGRSLSWLPLPSQGGNSHSLVSKFSTLSRKSGTGSCVSSVPSTNNCRYFSFSEILEMTNNFDEKNVVGVGGFGKVYKGVLDDGISVAVKRGNPTSDQGFTEFQTEIELLSKLRHRHLVSLIGFCEENAEMIVVYDYMANGPLRSHLYGAGLPALSWKQRLDICIGAARGLHYLHTGAAHGIIHRDVKTTNILLDENLVAKVSDFGLSKTGPTLDHTHVSTAVKGSFGYLDPEYFRRQQLTEKSDVYSFGVVLLEVLCARPAINPTLPREQVNIAEWAMHWQTKGMLEHIIDPVLVGKIGKESLKKFGETAEKCLAESGLDRPSMGDTLWNLEYALQLHETSAEKDFDMSNPKVAEILVKELSEVELSEIDVKKMDSSHNSGMFSVDSDETTASAVFSQLVKPQGR